MTHISWKLVTTLVLLVLCSQIKADDSATSQREKDTVRIQISNSGLKPWLGYNDGEARKIFNSAVHGQALVFTNNLDIRPGYLKSWEWDRVNKKFIFEVDTSQKYHNGQNISAYDFEFVLIKPFITTLPTTNERIPLSFIKGIESLKPGMKFKSGMAEGIKVINNQKIEVQVPAGHSRFIYALGPLLPALAPISEFEDDLYTLKKLPIGCGPYKVVFSDPNSSLVRLEKVSGKFGPKFIEVYSDKTAGENKVDLAVGGGVAGMKKYTNEHPGEYQRLQTPLPVSIELLVFNYQTEAAKDIRFRQAVSMAIDTVTPVPGFTSQAPINQVIPSLSYGFKQDVSFPYNPQKAKEIFNTLPKKIRDAEHTVVFHGSPSAPPGAYYESIYNGLKATGMKVKLVLAEQTSIPKGEKGITMVVFGRYIDSNPLTSFAYYLPGTSYETLSPNPNYKIIFDKAEAAESMEEKTKYLVELSRLIDKDKIVVPLHQRYGVYYISKRVTKSGLIEENSNFDVTKIEIESK